MFRGLDDPAAATCRADQIDSLMDLILDQGGEPVIPPGPPSKAPALMTRRSTRNENINERFFARLKHFRRVATRYDKLLANFLGFAKIVAIALCIK